MCVDACNIKLPDISSVPDTTCVHVCARVVMLVIAYVPFSVCVLMLVISCECTRHTFTSYPPKKMKEKENKKRLVTLAKPLPTSAPP